jgi:heme A synthase
MKEVFMRILIVIAVFEIAIGTAVAVLSPTTFNERFVALALGVVIAASIVLIATLLTPDSETVVATQDKSVDEVASRRARVA